MEKVLFNLSNSIFPILTDNPAATNFYFLIFKKFFEEMKFKFPNLDEKQILFISALQSLKALEEELCKKNKLSVSSSVIESFCFNSENLKNCKCSKELESTGHYVEKLINSINLICNK